MLRFPRRLPSKFLSFSQKKGIGFDLSSREAYKNLEVIDAGKGIFEIMLKGKKLRTPSKNPLKIPSLPLAREIVSELRTEKQGLDNDTPLFDLATNANERENDRSLRDYYIDFIRDYFKNDLIYNRRPDDTKMGRFQKTTFDPIFTYIEQETKVKLPINYFERQEEFTDPELILLRKHIESCDIWLLTSIEGLVNLTKSSAISVGLLKDLLNVEKLNEINEMEIKYSVPLYGKNSDPHEPITDKTLETIKKIKAFHDFIKFPARQTVS